MKKIVVMLALLGVFLIGIDAQAASLDDKAKLKPQVVANRHGGPGGMHGGPKGGGHAAPAMRAHGGHRVSGHVSRPPVAHVNHPRPHSVGRPIPSHYPRHRVYVGSRMVRTPYYADCIDPMGFYDPYYCGMYYSPAVIRYSTPSVGFSVAF